MNKFVVVLFKINLTLALFAAEDEDIPPSLLRAFMPNTIIVAVRSDQLAQRRRIGMPDPPLPVSSPLLSEYEKRLATVTLFRQWLSSLAPVARAVEPRHPKLEDSRPPVGGFGACF